MENTSSRIYTPVRGSQARFKPTGLLGTVERYSEESGICEFRVGELTFTVNVEELEGTGSECSQPIQWVTPDVLGSLVRDEWVRWARMAQPTNFRHLVPWESLDENNREVDRRIGERLYMHGVEHSDEERARQALINLGWEWEAFERHLDLCSPKALRATLALLNQPVTGDPRLDSLALAAKKKIEALLTR